VIAGRAVEYPRCEAVGCSEMMVRMPTCVGMAIGLVTLLSELASNASWPSTQVWLQRTNSQPPDLYNSKEMSMGAAFPIIANSAALLSCLVACILLSIPYYLPDCPQKHELRTCRELPFLEYPSK